MHFPLRKILCPVGFDDQERAALDAAKQLAGGFATVYLLHVVPSLPAIGEPHVAKTVEERTRSASWWTIRSRHPNREWASFHDVTHRVLEWHRPYFLGDTATTLDPDNPLALSG